MKVKSPRLPNPKADKATTQKLLAFTQVIAIVLLTCVATFILTIKVFLPAPDFLRDWAIKHGHNALKQNVGTYKAYKAYLKLPIRLVQSFKASELPKLNIDIKFKHFTKLTEKRAEALDEGILVQKPDDFVPAAIRMDNRTIKVKIRLKGDWTDHLEGNKWSFRVRVKGKEQIFGMKRFSIQNPKVRGYQSELLFLETLRGLGILAPRYFFVEVAINGDDIGIMALEEHFSKELLESNGCRENVIVRFDESLVWAAQDGTTRHGRKTGFNGTFDNYQNAVIDAFQSAKIQKSKHLRNEYDIAVGLLRGFMDGHLSASRVFDAELFGKYLGASEFWGAKHATRWHNLRLYLNPITLKLEPIGFDADLRATVSPYFIIAQNEPISIAVLQDNNIFNVYHETIQKLAREFIDGGDLKNNIDIVEKKHLSDLRKEFYLLEKYPYRKLNIRAIYLLSLNKIRLRDYIVNTSAENKKTPEGLPTLIHAFRIKDDNGFHIELANATPHEVEVRSINWIDNNGKPSFGFQQLSRKSFPILLEPTPIGSLPKIQRISYRNPSAANLDSLEISAAFSGQKQTRKTVAISYSNALTRSPVPESTPDEQLSRHNFLTLDNPKKSLLVQPGIWHVSGSLVIPAGFTLKVSAGTTLKFSPNEGLFSHGPLFFNGTSDRPIILEGISSKDHGNSWQGITVLNANSQSVWSHVIVRDTAGLSRLGWVLTGGVTFYKSDIRMSHCRLKGNLGEDALNIIHSKFELTGIEILESTSDGFDADFADGEIKDCLLKEIGKTTGGDAIDISGSEVLVTGCRFLNISDKALSVGEGSRMKASGLDIRHVGTGAASKDGSSLSITDSSIKDARIAGLMAYIKKPEYGPGSIEANNVTFLNTTHESRVQRGSNISINGEQMETEDVDVKSLYETIMKPGSRK